MNTVTPEKVPSSGNNTEEIADKTVVETFAPVVTYDPSSTPPDDLKEILNSSVTVTNESKAMPTSKLIKNEHGTSYPSSSSVVTRHITKVTKKVPSNNYGEDVLESIEKVVETITPTHDEQTTMTQFGFVCPVKGNDKGEPKAPTTLPNNETYLNNDVMRKLHSLETNTLVTNHPNPDIKRNIRDSDVKFLNLTDIVEESHPEPVYTIFGEGVEPIASLAIGCEDKERSPDCDECFYDCCHEKLFGPYCCAAVKRYFDENEYEATLKDAYVVFIEHYNRQLDVYTYQQDGGEGDRISRESTPVMVPHCMKVGSLFHSIEWINWHINFGPHKAFYEKQRAKKRRARQRKIQQKNAEARKRYSTRK